MPKKILADGVRWECTEKHLRFFKDVGEIPTTDQVVGQERAMTALDLGLKLRHPGFNVYVSGVAGTGRSGEVQAGVCERNVNDKASW